jgi:hypothetical protein
MGFLKKLFATKEIVVDPADLFLPEVIQTTKQGLSLRKGIAEQLVEINIVGESFRSANVDAVAKAAEGREFEIYLVAEPTNQYDKSAVAVYVANLQIGYISKPANKQWVKWVNEALQRGELLWGPGRAIARKGADNIGIFGGIYMPQPSDNSDPIVALKLSDLALAKAIEKVVALSNSSEDPQTIAQLRSLAKKTVKASRPLAAHAIWIQENSSGQDAGTWIEVLDACEEIFNEASKAVYATDEGDSDLVSAIDQLAELLDPLRPIA